MIEDAAPVLRDVEILKSVAIVVAHRNALPEPSGCDTGLLGHIGKCSVAIVLIQRVAQWLGRREKIALAAVHQIDVHPAVVVVVKERTACPSRLRQVFRVRVCVRMRPGNPAVRCGYDFEGILRGSRRGAQKTRRRQRVRQHRKSGSCCQPRDHLAPAQQPLAGAFASTQIRCGGTTARSLRPADSSRSSCDESQILFQPLRVCRSGCMPVRDCSVPKDCLLPAALPSATAVSLAPTASASPDRIPSSYRHPQTLDPASLLA